MIIRAGDLFIEVVYTRDNRLDRSDGGWSAVPEEPDGGGWILWDTVPDRKSGGLRVWGQRGRGLYVHAEGGRA